MRCNQCDSLYINGIFCHETGCPNANKVYDPVEKEWRDPEPEADEEDDDDTIYCDGCGNRFHKYMVAETDDGNFCEHCNKPFEEEDI